ncbi:MAG: hypothetical protein KIT87_11025 [Anaerolineae bacterium]|nr:hypothetical protein [Anaerolineae bacterium]
MVEHPRGEPGPLVTAQPGASRYTVALKPGARDQLKTLDLQVRAALAEAILDLQFDLPQGAEADEIDPQRFSVYLPPVASGLRPFLVYRVVPPPASSNDAPGEVTVITVAQYASPAAAQPEGQAEPITPVSTPAPPSKYLVYDTLVQKFTRDEIDDLIFDLGRDLPDLDGESLPRDTKEELARELVQFCARRGVLDKLVERVRAKRPEVVKL